MFSMLNAIVGIYFILHISKLLVQQYTNILRFTVLDAISYMKCCIKVVCIQHGIYKFIDSKACGYSTQVHAARKPTNGTTNLLLSECIPQ